MFFELVSILLPLFQIMVMNTWQKKIKIEPVLKILFKNIDGFIVFLLWSTHSEVPDRIQRPYDKLKEYGLLERCQEITVSLKRVSSYIDLTFSAPCIQLVSVSVK